VTSLFKCVGLVFGRSFDQDNLFPPRHFTQNLVVFVILHCKVYHSKKESYAFKIEPATRTFGEANRCIDAKAFENLHENDKIIIIELLFY